MDLLPVYRVTPPSLSRVSDYLAMSWSERQLTNRGPCVRLLERRLSEYFALPEDAVVVAGNATLAIQGGMQTSPKTEETWFVPAWTFPASYLAAQQSGRQYEIVDVNRDGRMSESFFDSTLLEVWPFGSGESQFSFVDRGQRIIDAAASFDALRGIGDRLSRNSSIVLSLHATKALACGEGGVFISSNAEWVSRFREWINFGFGKGTRVPRIIGTNAKMSEGDAAIALASLDNWDDTRRKWEALSRELVPFLENLGLSIPLALQERKATNYLIIETEQIAKDEEVLREVGLESRRWWTPANKSPELELKLKPGELFTNSNRLFETWLGLPFFLSMDTKLWKDRMKQFVKLRKK